MEVVTFGQPLVGDQKFVDSFRELCDGKDPSFKSTRYVNTNVRSAAACRRVHKQHLSLPSLTPTALRAQDIVPRVPSSWLGYHHVEDGIVIDAQGQLKESSDHDFAPMSWLSAFVKVYRFWGTDTKLRRATRVLSALCSIPLLGYGNFLSDHFCGDYVTALEEVKDRTA